MEQKQKHHNTSSTVQYLCLFVSNQRAFMIKILLQWSITFNYVMYYYAQDIGVLLSWCTNILNFAAYLNKPDVLNFYAQRNNLSLNEKVKLSSLKLFFRYNYMLTIFDHACMLTV